MAWIIKTPAGTFVAPLLDQIPIDATGVYGPLSERRANEMSDEGFMPDFGPADLLAFAAFASAFR